jgi:hypothetical protein
MEELAMMEIVFALQDMKGIVVNTKSTKNLIPTMRVQPE